MRILIITMLILCGRHTVNAQNSSFEKDVPTMTQIVTEGLESKPKSFFNKGTEYDYKSNVKIVSIEIPSSQTFTGFEGKDAVIFFCKLKSTIEGKEETNFYKIMSRLNSSGDLNFFSATLWSEENIQ